MESCKCPITGEIFEDPVVGDDGHTYERVAITEWLSRNKTSPITRQPMSINSLKTNYTVKKIIEEWKSAPQSQQTQYHFQLDVDIRKTRTRPLFQGFGKSIYEVEWTNRSGPPIILLKIDGAKANREASFYVQLSCHPNIVRTFGLVQSNPGSVMLLQEYAPHGDLSELLRENGFKPTEQVLRRIFEQICDAMICLVDNGIIHGDLACRNVLVFRSNPNKPKENLVKLTDFGLTRGSTVYSMVDSPSMSTMTVVPTRYVSPEILRNPDRSNYSEKSDIYAMGVLMWEALSYGQLPYSSLHDDNDVRKRKLNDERLQQPFLCGHSLWTIINQCWNLEAVKRPSFIDLKELLSSIHTKQSSSSKVVNKFPNQTQVPSSQDNVVIPCEFCDALIDRSDWSTHIGICRQQEQIRLEQQRCIISQTPIKAQIPCEYCGEACYADNLLEHQANCDHSTPTPQDTFRDSIWNQCVNQQPSKTNGKGYLMPNTETSINESNPNSFRGFGPNQYDTTPPATIQGKKGGHSNENRLTDVILVDHPQQMPSYESNTNTPTYPRPRWANRPQTPNNQSNAYPSPFSSLPWSNTLETLNNQSNAYPSPFSSPPWSNTLETLNNQSNANQSPFSTFCLPNML